MMIRVKVCGITTRRDAWTAIDHGVDALGVLVGLAHESADELAAADARRIVASVPPFVDTTLVTHRDDPAEVGELVAEVKPQVVQLHGPFPLEDISALRETYGVKVIKTVHVEDESSVATAVEAAQYADAVLLDTRTPDRLGGTGVTHDWSISRRIRDALALVPSPVILAGGLTPANVGEAIDRVRPYAVDVNSGVSVARGRKSPQLIAEFLRAART